MPVSTLTGTWTRLLAADRLRRSSQILSVVDQSVCIFGGEVLPREPVDNQVDVFSLSSEAPTLQTKSSTSAPSPRVGSASAVVNGKVYLFSGRGGTDMAPIDEHGAVWSYDPAQSSWEKITPLDSSKPYPPARSYHCATSDGQNTLFFHAGCPASGRLADFWKYDVSSRSWTQAPDAPAAPRGGTSIAYLTGKIYRMNGFDGNKEVGGAIDIFDISSNTWSSEPFPADGNAGPEPRSVAALLPVKLLGKDKLLTLFGESDPSSLGHAGAGRMRGDAWIYDVSENWWTKLNTNGPDGLPEPRGWFDADVVQSQDRPDRVIVHGGLAENNQRLSDVWVLDF
ncbi:kelch repeat protein-like protein [Dendryphion nanum]|uniref:Kelch repeat protein-like protein n=1 Tax=Dendryphion nanum TaxID=256645 RepID=A0A9P9IAI4_9PLEO|nr:kelch repeat protein-like protein [Dendryphion nanum]